jgi:phosphopantetheine adenylyltransferase
MLNDMQNYLKLPPATVLMIYIVLNMVAYGCILLLAYVGLEVFRPTISTMPDPDGHKDQPMEEDHESSKQGSHGSVLLAGSYNPAHNGHLAMLSYLATAHSKNKSPRSAQSPTVYAVVGFNPKKIYDVSPEKRVELLQKMLAATGLDKKGVVAVAVPGYIWRWAKKNGVSTMFRGIRSWEKDGSDERKLHVLNTLGPIFLGPLSAPVPTVYLQYDPSSAVEVTEQTSDKPPPTRALSSTYLRSLARECCHNNGTGGKEQLNQCLPSAVVDSVISLYGSKSTAEGGRERNANLRGERKSKTQ